MKPMHHHPNCKGCGAIKVVHRLDANHITLLDAFIITIDSFTSITIIQLFSLQYDYATLCIPLYLYSPMRRILCMDADDDKHKASSSGGLDMLTFCVLCESPFATIISFHTAARGYAFLCAPTILCYRIHSHLLS